MAAPICLITILYNSEDGLPGFLACLQAQDMPDWHLIVVDNASPDGSLALVSALADPRITTIRNTTNLGFAKAANQGLRAAASVADFAVLFNNDTWFAPDFLRRLIEARARLGADVIAPRIMDMERPEVSFYAGGHMEDGWVFRNVHDPYQEGGGDQPRTVGFACGCCLGLTPAALDRVGYFDESFFVYWEDVDLCMRLNAAGVPIHYVPEPVLLHQGAAASGGVSSPAHDRLYYRSYMQLLRKHFGFRRASRTMLRLVAKEVGQPNRDGRHIRSMTAAMARGLAAPLVRAAPGQGAAPPGMRVVIALPEYWNTPIGGYHVHYQYANLLSRRGHDVTVVFPRSLRPGHPIKSRVRAPLWALQLRLQNRPLIGSFPLDARVKVRLLRDLSGSVLPRADVLIATAWQTAEAMADAPARCGRKIYVVYDYEHLMTASPDVRARIEATYRMPYTTVATSGIVADTIRRCGGEPVATVPCGLDFDAFGMDVPAGERQRLTLGFPARLESFKGTADAVSAAAILRERYGDALRVGAFGSRRPDLPDWIEWHQYPSQADLRRFYNAQSVFMVPSHFEGWGLPGAEALACGAALVTTDNGGCRDYAVDGRTALVVPSGEPEILADAAARLFEDDGLRHRLAQSGNGFVRRYTWDDAADELEKVFRS